MRILIFLAFGLGEADVLLAQGDEVTDVEAMAISARRAIHSGELEIVAILTNGDDQPVLKNEYWIQFEGDNLRFDFHVSQQIDESNDGRQSGIKRESILTSEGLLSHDDPEHLGMNTAVSKEAMEDHADGHPGVLFDPRLLGMSPSPTGMLHGHHFELFVGSPVRTNVTVGSESVDENSTTRVEFLRNDGARARMWIDPDRGYNTVRAELESNHLGETWLNSIECELKQYDAGGIWFPHVVIYRQYHDGVLHNGEIITVQNATFNEDVDDDRFTLATMNVPPGTPIAESKENPDGTQMWDGERLVRMSNPDLDYGGLADTNGRERFWGVLITTNLLIILAIGFYAYRRSHRRRSSDTGMK